MYSHIGLFGDDATGRTAKVAPNSRSEVDMTYTVILVAIGSVPCRNGSLDGINSLMHDYGIKTCHDFEVFD